MGCGTPTSDSAMGPKVVSPIGKLRITLVNATIYHKVSSLKMDPYMIVGFNSQVFTSKVIKDGDKSPVFSDSFSFFINSCYKSNGRNL
jgi:Ca2+-dependent lipid-binding protein